MNKAILVGRLARDPEVKYTQSGKCVATFTIAVNRYAGNGENTADFIPVVVWEKLAEIVGNHLTKGSKVLVEGRIQVRSYEAKDGGKRYVTEIIAQNIEFMDSKKPSSGAGASAANGAESFGSEVFPDEEIPF